MKLKLVLAGLAVVCMVASSAIAAPPDGKGPPEGKGKPAQTPPAGKGKPDPTGPNCKPKIAVILKGTYVSASTGSLKMNVTGGNRWGRVWKNSAVEVTLNDATKVRGGGMKTIDDLLERLKDGDRVLVQARVCKAELKDPVTTKPELTAAKVIGHPAKAENDEQEDD